MEQFSQIPEWLGGALIGAAIAAFGYVGNLILSAVIKAREEKNARQARLVELHCLLRAGKVSFDIQKELNEKLDASIRASQPKLSVDMGYERRFSSAYKKFSANEKELHSLIQSITIHSLKPTNEAVSAWLKSDTYFRAQKVDDSPTGKLSRELAQLEAHLLLWHAKYEASIPSHPEHALVYLADEERHGVGFPHGIEDVVERVLKG